MESTVRWVYDRAHAISELLKSDQPQGPTSISNVYNIHDSNFVSSSPNAVIEQTITHKTDELRTLVSELKKFSAAQELASKDREEMNVYIGTIELQVGSPRPNSSIIRSCLESTQSIVENAVGAVAGAGMVAAIKHYLHLP